MADQTVTFANKIASATVLQDLKTRINNVFSAAALTSTTPASGAQLTFSGLNETYQAAKTAIFTITGSQTGCTRSLDDFTGTTISGLHGIGIVEKTVGDLENLCPSHYGTNNVSFNSSNFTSFWAESNTSNFSGVNSSNCSFTPASGSCTDNSGNFVVGNNGFHGSFGYPGNNGSHADYTYDLWHTYYSYCYGQNVWVNSPYYRYNYAANYGNNGFFAGHFGSNFNFNFSGNKSSFTAAQNSTNFSSFGSNSANKSSFRTASLVCTGNNASNFTSYNFNCAAVHSVFSVEGVDI